MNLKKVSEPVAMKETCDRYGTVAGVRKVRIAVVDADSGVTVPGRSGEMHWTVALSPRALDMLEASIVRCITPSKPRPRKPKVSS